VEADHGGLWKRARERPSRPKARTGSPFVKAATAAAVRIVGSFGASFAAAASWRSAETRPPQAPEREPVAELGLRVDFPGGAGEASSTARTRRCARQCNRCDDRRQSGTMRGVKDVLGLTDSGEIGEVGRVCVTTSSVANAVATTK